MHSKGATIAIKPNDNEDLDWHQRNIKTINEPVSIHIADVVMSHSSLGYLCWVQSQRYILTSAQLSVGCTARAHLFFWEGCIWEGVWKDPLHPVTSQHALPQRMHCHTVAQDKKCVRPCTSEQWLQRQQWLQRRRLTSGTRRHRKDDGNHNLHTSQRPLLLPLSIHTFTVSASFEKEKAQKIPGWVKNWSKHIAQHNWTKISPSPWRIFWTTNKKIRLGPNFWLKKKAISGPSFDSTTIYIYIYGCLPKILLPRHSWNPFTRGVWPNIWSILGHHKMALFCSFWEKSLSMNLKTHLLPVFCINFYWKIQNMLVFPWFWGGLHKPTCIGTAGRLLKV